MSGVTVSTMTSPSTSVGPGPRKEGGDHAPVGMGDEHVRAGFARGCQHPMEVVGRLVGRMRLGDRG